MSNLEKRFPYYSKLLTFFPQGYRAEYGEQMLQTLADMLDDPQRTRGGVWLRTTVDFPVSLLQQQLTYTGDFMANQMPLFIKRNAQLGAWLVAPFFLFVILGIADSHRINESVFWHTKALFMWLVLLPGLALIFNLAALLRWIQMHRKDTNQSAWKVLTDFRYNWPTLVILVIAICILGFTFGHDSIRCLSGNPVREVHNPHQTLLCLEQR